MTQIDPEKLSRAIAIGRTQWLREFLQECLPKIIPLSDSPEDLDKAKDWNDQIKAHFRDRGLTKLSQQKDRMTEVRNAIKVFNPFHPTLDIIGFSPTEWIEINQTATKATDNRTTQLIPNPDAIEERASSLLLSRKWSQVAAGLAVVTGRRVSEILQTAEFDKVSEYSVMFSGAAKRRNETVPLKFEIPTLVKAQGVIEAVAYLRSQLDTRGLNNRQINDKYEPIVSRECDRHFRDLVPLRDGKTNLYTHLFRAVYATIATHWYCPPTVSDLEFRAYIQGHFKLLDETSEQKRLSLANQKHYWDYKISDGHGNVDGRLGIKLDLPDVTVIEYFATTNHIAHRHNLGRLVTLKVWSSDRDALSQFQADFQLDNRQNTHHFVLQTFQQLQAIARNMNQTPQQLLEQLSKMDDFNQLRNAAITPENLESDEGGLSSEDVGEPLPSNSVRRDTKTHEKSSQILFDKLEQQQQSLQDLTLAIHRLVHTLNQSHHSPITNTTGRREPLATANHSPTTFDQPEIKQSETKSSETRCIDSSTEKPQLSPRQLRSKQKRQEVSDFIDRIIAFNNQPNRPHGDKWLVTVAGLMRLAGCGQSIVYDVYNSRLDEIQQHHAFHQLDDTHNKKDKDHPKIEAVFLSDSPDHS